MAFNIFEFVEFMPNMIFIFLYVRLPLWTFKLLDAPLIILPTFFSIFPTTPIPHFFLLLSHLFVVLNHFSLAPIEPEWLLSPGNRTRTLQDTIQSSALAMTLGTFLTSLHLDRCAEVSELLCPLLLDTHVNCQLPHIHSLTS